MRRLFSGLAVLPFLASIASAGQPLSDQQMDGVVAGGICIAPTLIYEIGLVPLVPPPPPPRCTAVLCGMPPGLTQSLPPPGPPPPPPPLFFSSFQIPGIGTFLP